MEHVRSWVSGSKSGLMHDLAASDTVIFLDFGLQ